MLLIALASPPWAPSIAEVLAAQQSTTDGLSEAEVARRIAEVGPNKLRQARRVTVTEILVNQLRSVIILLLVGASLLSFAVGDWIEGTAIGVTIALTVALGFATELRAVRSMEALRRLGAVRARVRRGGVDRMIPAEQLVPGDIVLLEAGDRISADARIIDSSKLQADESALTGESVPVSKRAGALAEQTALAERTNMLYKGATITRGSGMGVVVATGMDTELGRIAALVEATDDELTPLERRLAALGHRLLWVCLGIAAVTATAGTLAGRGVMLMIETGIALAVAAVPEGLPVVATVALARGMWRLAARRALITRLSAVETLGATSVIVADKTGTLTENRLSVAAIAVADAEYHFGDDVSRDGARVDAQTDPHLVGALEIAALCNNASIAAEQPSGDPLEVALLRAVALAGIDSGELIRRQPELREDAFDPATKMMATFNRTAGAVRVAVKGAPEAVLEACTRVRASGDDEPLTTERRNAWLARSQDMASSGLRVLALAEKTAASAEVPAYEQLTLIGLVGLADPPRTEVAVPLAECRRAGIQVVMATGDQPATAASIARAVGLANVQTAEVIHGHQVSTLATMAPEQREAMRRAPVFARVTPEQKLDIIELHQQNGAVVAMTGDGVNDAPALRKAEIGIAMGARGTDVAREAAVMVLEDDSFESIVVAVEQGRAIFENIRRFVIYLLSCNISELLIVTSAVLLGAPLPLLPLQILFLNLVTDVFPALALGFGEGDPRAMSRPPRDAREPIVGRPEWRNAIAYAMLLTASVLAAMFLARAHGASNGQATTVSFLTLGLAQVLHVFNMRGRGTRLFDNDVVRNPWVWGAIALCVTLLAIAAFFPPLTRVLAVEALDATSWLIVAGMSTLPLAVGQLVIGHGRDE